MEGRFGDIVLTARYFYVTALVHLTKDFDDLIYSVSFLFHVSGRVFARQSLIFNGPVCGGQVSIRRDVRISLKLQSVLFGLQPSFSLRRRLPPPFHCGETGRLDTAG